MPTDRKENPAGSDIWSQWLESTLSAWSQLATPAWAAPFQQAAEKAAGSFGDQTQKQWQSAGQLFTLMASGMTDPTNFAGLTNSSQILQQMLTGAAQQVFDSLGELQRQMADRAAKLGQRTAAYSFEDLDLGIFDTWRDIYEGELKKYLTVPQLGLARSYQEHWAQFADAAAQYQSAAAEFVYLFGVPLKKATEVVQEQLQKDSEAGEFPQSGRDLYAKWVKVLEGHYMRLLQSADYTRVLNQLLDKLAHFRRARELLLQDLLQDLPVATNTDMDALYKEHHRLKRRVRTLEKALAQKDRIE
jgi:hypothetical protein